MIKNDILVPVRETMKYKWYTMYLETENGEINIFYPVNYNEHTDRMGRLFRKMWTSGQLDIASICI